MADEPTAPVPQPRRRRVGIAAAALLVAVCAVVLAGWLALRSEAGLLWLLQRAPGLSTDGVQGSLGSGHIAVRKLRWAGAAGQLEIEALVLDGLQWQLRPALGQWVGVQAGALTAARVQWTTAPSDAPAAPLSPPTDLALPLALQVPLAIGSLQVDTAPEIRDLSLQLALGVDGGVRHEVSGLALQTAGIRLHDGRLQVGTAAPIGVGAALSLAGDGSTPLPWQADLQASGTLQRVEVTGRLRSGEATAVDLAAALAPFARWPLAGLRLKTEALDLAQLDGRLPQTALRGHADLSGGDASPLQVDLQLDNQRPGRWNEGRLPLKRIEARVRGDLSRPDVLDIEALSLQAAGNGGDAGRWQARGRWEGHTLTLDNTIEGLRPQQLDARAIAGLLGGRVALAVRGLPSPDPAASAPTDAPSLTLDAGLQGHIDGASRPLSLQAKAELAADRVDVKSFALASGKAQATGQASIARNGKRWVARGQGALVEFDPAAWWSGAADSVWRRGPHRLNAEWSMDLSLAAAALDKAPTAWLPALAGRARLHVPPSTIAGLPLQADIAISDAPVAKLAGWLELAGNRLQVDGQTDLRGRGDTDRWQLALKAPALAALAPLTTLHPAVGAWAPKQGRISAHATVQGRWPQLQTEGEIEVHGLHAAELEVDQARANWHAAEGLTAPLQARLTLDGLRWAGQPLQSLQADLSGTLAQHHLAFQAATPFQPPPALAQGLGLTLQHGTRVALELDGAWVPSTDGGGRWVGQATTAEAASWNGETLPAPKSDAPWLEAGGLKADVLVDAAGSLLQAHLAPGRLALAGGFRLRWDDLQYSKQDEHFALKAQVENFRIAPLLARWQPEIGWAGDLEVGLQIELRAAEQFDADIVLERAGGDLSVVDSADRKLQLGLTDLRLALNAHEGTWYFTQALAGPRLGELGGAVRVRTSPARRWPEPGAALDGSVQARVANLGVWGSWVPPGWRLQGQLQTGASFGGTFGAPEVTGTLTGSGLGARNLLLGVNVRDGEVAVRLEGERATVENFVLRAGDGSLRITGGATLGAAPAIQLAMVADKLQVLGRIDRRLVMSGDAEFLLDPSQLKLDGRLLVDSGLFDTSRADAPSLDEDVVVQRKGSAPPVAKEATTDAPARRTDVRVMVDLGQKLQLRSHGLDTRLAGQLQVTAPAGKLAVNGTVSTVSGSFAGYGQKMVIERGQVVFSGPPDNPRLDVLALRPGLDVDVGVEIIGSVNAPRVRLYSNPEMSDKDKLSWLVLGREPGATGSADTALLQRAALALLAGDGDSQTELIFQKLGLDSLSVRQSDDATPETIVSVGKQISDRWYVGYERGVNATVGTWEIVYRVARQFKVRLESGLSQSLDALWTWKLP